MGSRFVFISDCHFAAASNVRSGDYLEDLVVKLRWVVSFANERDATILDGGDFFDKSVVPDSVKVAVIRELTRCSHMPLCVRGNHDRMYGNEEFNDRTSLSVLHDARVVRELRRGESVEYDDVVIRTGLPFLSSEDGRPQILLYHGFLNEEDGDFSIMYQDIQCDTPALVLLGHDHQVYDALRYKGCTILRPGSFARAIRTDANDRVPQVVYIEVVDGGFSFSLHPIESARPVELLFKNKVNVVKRSSIDYGAIIEQIRQSCESEDELMPKLRMVADEPTVGYISDVLAHIGADKK